MAQQIWLTMLGLIAFYDFVFNTGCHISDKLRGYTLTVGLKTLRDCIGISLIAIPPYDSIFLKLVLYFLFEKGVISHNILLSLTVYKYMP